MRHGFTLIELSIVLVIIGLLVGGVFVGKSMIEAATFRAEVADIQKVRAACLAFKDKYFYLPGDLPNATAFWNSASQPSQVSNGNGNGLIEVSAGGITGGDQNAGWGWSHAGSYSEFTGVFDQLSAAGLISMPQYDETITINGLPLRFQSGGSASDVIGTVISPACLNVAYIPGYSYLTDGHKIVLGAVGCNTTRLLAGQSAGINGWEAYLIDSKIDDGVPLTGSAVIMNVGYLYRAVNYCSNGANYLTESNMSIGAGGIPRARTCALYISAGF